MGSYSLALQLQYDSVDRQHAATLLTIVTTKGEALCMGGLALIIALEQLAMA